MNAPGTARGKDTRTVGELYMAFELGEKNWKLSLSDGAHSPSR
jgi:transposase